MKLKVVKIYVVFLVRYSCYYVVLMIAITLFPFHVSRLVYMVEWMIA